MFPKPGPHTLNDWGALLRLELAKTPITAELTEAQAQKAAAAAWETVGQEARTYLAQTMTKKAAELRSDREHQERQQQRRAEHRKREEKEAKAALRKLFGRKIADDVEAAGLFAEYRVGEIEGATLAVRADRVATLTSRLPSLTFGGSRGGEAEWADQSERWAQDRAVPGHRLGTLVKRIDAVVGDDLDPAVELVRERRARRKADENQRSAAEAASRQAARERERTKQQYGVELSARDLD